MSSSTQNKVLGFFSLVMINVIAVDSLRSLPISAEYGFSLVFFYIVAALVFFIPSILISAELATMHPSTGGIYVWTREAFGPKVGFLVIWFQWVYNVVWYPTIMAFVAASIAYFFNPLLANNKVYLLSVTIGLFWLATVANCFGMKVSSLLSTLGAIFGTLLPMLLIVCLGAVWLWQGHPIQTQISWNAFLPHMGDWNNLGFLSAVIFGLIGMEMSAVHAGEVKDPTRAYPKALWVSGIIIFMSLVFASLAVAIVIPKAKISLVTGLLQAFTFFFGAYHLTWMVPVMIALIIVGSASGVAAWIIGPSKGLVIAARDGCLPKCFSFTNKRGAPVFVLVIQGLIFTALCSVFLLIPNINASYWLLSAMTAQLGLIVYIALFAAAFRLRYKQPNAKRCFKVPGGKVGMFLVTLLGILGCFFAIAIGFIPPAQLHLGSTFEYDMILLMSLAVFSVPPFILYRSATQKETKKDSF